MKTPAILVAGLLLVCQAAPAEVHFPVDGVMPDGAPMAAPAGGAIRYPVRVDRAWIGQSANLGGLWLPGTGRGPVLARFERSLRSANSWTWVGRVQTDAGPQAVVITFGKDGAVFGRIPQQTGAPLRIETTHGRPMVLEGGQASAPLRLGPMGDALLPSMRAGHSIAIPYAATVTAPPPLVDLLVVYTSTLVAVDGSDAATRARIDFLVAVSNQAYIDSGAGIRIRTVARKRIDYPDEIGGQASLEEITNGTTAVKTQVDAWRAQYGADLVLFLRPYYPEGECGLGWLNGYHGSAFDKQNGYSLVRVGGLCADDLTFPHELGHNMGSHHDNDATGGDYGAFPYSRGYGLTIDANSGFGTVMAYKVSPRVRVGLFSNPRLTCSGYPCGIANFADNARSLTRAAAGVAAMVDRVVLLDGVPREPLRALDANGDGFSDLVFFNHAQGRVSTWYMHGTLRIGMSSFALAQDRELVDVADFDGNGSGDLLFTDATRNLWIAFSNGFGYTMAAVANPYASSQHPIAAADINGDGKADILLRDSNTGRVTTWYMAGATRITYNGYAVSPGFRFVGHGDLNGDRRQDLLWTDASRRLLLSSSTGSGFGGQLLSLSYRSGYTVAGLQDINGDGRDDILLIRNDGLQLVSWLMNGANRTAYASTGILATERLVAKGSFDGDHRGDLIMLNPSTRRIRFLTSTGSRFTGAILSLIPQAGSDLMDVQPQ